MSYFVRILSVGFLVLSVATLLPVPPDAGSEDLDCGPYAHWEPEVGSCYIDAPPYESPEVLAVLEDAAPVPPPPGAIVLYPGGEREEMEECPEGFRETSGDHGWRFCVDKVRPEAIPPLWAPPIAGIPYEECREIFKRSKATLNGCDHQPNDKG